MSALLGIVIPTFAIIIVLGALLGSFQHNIYVQAALKGIRPIVVALIASAAYKMGLVSVVDKICAALCAVCIISLLLFKSLNLILVIFLGAFAGIVIVKVKDQQNKRLSHKKAGETL